MGSARAHDFIIVSYILICMYIFPYIFPYVNLEIKKYSETLMTKIKKFEGLGAEWDFLNIRGGGYFHWQKKENQNLPHIELCSNLCDSIGKLEKKSKITHYRFEQDESLKKRFTI